VLNWTVVQLWTGIRGDFWSAACDCHGLAATTSLTRMGSLRLGPQRFARAPWRPPIDGLAAPLGATSVGAGRPDSEHDRATRADCYVVHCVAAG